MGKEVLYLLHEVMMDYSFYEKGGDYFLDTSFGTPTFPSYITLALNDHEKASYQALGKSYVESLVAQIRSAPLSFKLRFVDLDIADYDIDSEGLS